MKHLYTLLFLILASTVVMQAQNLGIEPMDTITHNYSTADSTELFEWKAFVRNNSAVTDTVIWEIVSQDLDDCWQVGYCDATDCHQIQFVQTERYSLKNGDTSQMKLQITPKLYTNSGELRVNAYLKSDGPQNAVTLTYQIDINGSRSCSTTVGIEHNAFDAMHIFPNPVQNLLNIKGFDGAFEVSIYNMLGKTLVKQTANSSTELNLEDLNQGIYLVAIKDLKTGAVNTQTVEKL